MSSKWICHLHPSVLRFPSGVMVAKTGGTVMKSRSSRSNISCTKTERKVVERNRRNQMKSLYSSLNSLLPNQNFKVLHLSLSLNSCLLVLFHSSLLSLTSHEEAKLSLLSCYCRQIIAFGLERFGIYKLRLDDISCSFLFLELAKLLKIFFPCCGYICRKHNLCLIR